MARSRLGIETLEDRATPAVMLSGDTLFVVGSNANDSMKIAENHLTDVLTVDDNGVLYTFNGEDVRRVQVLLYEGNNSFNYSITGKAGFLNEKSFDIFSGNGFDYLSLDFRGPNSQPVQDDIDLYFSTGGLGDQVAVYLPTIDDAEVSVGGNLGSGNDGFTLLQTGDLDDDATLAIDVGGAAGSDTMMVLAQYDVDLDSDASLSIRLDGGADADWVEARYRGEMDGDLDIELRGGTENDFVRSDARFDIGSTGDAWLDVFGDAGVDNLYNNVTASPASYVDILSQITQQ